MSDTLPSGWTWQTADQVAAPSPYSIAIGPFGSNLLRQDYRDAGVRLVFVRDIMRKSFDDPNARYVSVAKAEQLHQHVARSGDVLITKMGEPPGDTMLFPAGESPAIITSDCIKFTPNKNVLGAEFLMLCLRSPVVRRQIAEITKGVAQQKISLANFRNITLPIPPLAEQRRIVARTEALFARTRRARTDLERIAPLSNRHRLAHLRAGVTGQLTEAWRHKRPAEDVRVALRRISAPEQGRGGREATNDVTPGMAALSVNDPETLAPPGWAWTPFLRVARQETGHTPSRRVPAYWDGGDVPWVGIRDAGAHHGTTIYDTMQKCTELGLANSSARLLPAGTVCLSRTASVGYVTVLGKSMATSQDFATWTCTPALLPEYLKFALLAEGDDIRRFGEGSTHTTIYFPEIRALHICLPPVEEQAEIVRILTSNAGGQTIASAEAASTLALLNRLEQSILSRAFSGELVPQGSHKAPGSVSTASPHSAAPEPRRGRPKAGIAA